LDCDIVDIEVSQSWGGGREGGQCHIVGSVSLFSRSLFFFLCFFVPIYVYVYFGQRKKIHTITTTTTTTVTTTVISKHILVELPYLALDDGAVGALNNSLT
jgi:hypothetical protein